MIPFTLGCDPEAFLADAKGNLKASCGLIGGTKQMPLPIPALGDGFAVQEDNVAIEFNIPPASTEREFVNSIGRVMKVLGDGINQRLGFHIVDESAASFPDEELQAPAAKEFGCDPDFNAWLDKRNPRPRAKDKNLRSCGGHLHIGYNKMFIPPKRVIRMADLCLGVPSVLMDTKGTRRRELYGKHGAYREKEYGVEYRTLGNFWIFHPRHTAWAWRAVGRTLTMAATDLDMDEYYEDIVKAIDKGNKESAMKLVKKFDLEVVNV